MATAGSNCDTITESRQPLRNPSSVNREESTLQVKIAASRGRVKIFAEAPGGPSHTHP